MKLLNTNLREIFNLAICAFGIQFATALQMANMSSIYKLLGAASSELSYLWLAAPISGLLVQPLVGQLSDSTESRFGKRIPYIFVWGLLACISLLMMSFSSTLLMAAILMWLLDCSINGCTEILRALTADIIPNSKKSTAFAMQTAFAGIGAGIAATLPWLLEKKSYFTAITASQYLIPLSIKYSFITGSLVLLICVTYLLFTIKEKPSISTPRMVRKSNQTKGDNSKKIILFFKEIIFNIWHMPNVIKNLYLVQILTWTGLFCLFLYFSIAIANRYFHVPSGIPLEHHFQFSRLFTKGIEWAGLCYGIYQFVSVIYAFLLPKIAEKTSTRFAYGISLICGALGMISIGFFSSPEYLIISMLGIGMMWGGVMTMPYAIISAELPKNKMGVYLGIFNITITFPQILAGLFLGIITSKIFHNNAIYTLMMGGVLILFSGVLMLIQNYSYKLVEDPTLKDL